jgi:HSP20 family protein
MDDNFAPRDDWHGFCPDLVVTASHKHLNKSTMTRITPVKRIHTPVVNRNFSDLIDELFTDTWARNQAREGFNPAVDIVENDSNYELHVNLPGMSKEDIQIQLEDNRLVISGERKYQFENKSEEGAKPRYHRIESGYGSFKRSFTLSNEIQRDNIQARFENGVLVVTLNKTDEGISKSITIQ